MLRCAVLLLLAAATLSLTGCALVQAPFKLMNNLIKAGGRTIGLGAVNTPGQPLRLDTGELERARSGGARPVEEASPAPNGQVAAR